MESIWVFCFRLYPVHCTAVSISVPCLWRLAIYNNEPIIHKNAILHIGNICVPSAYWDSVSVSVETFAMQKLSPSTLGQIAVEESAVALTTLRLNRR